MISDNEISKLDKILDFVDLSQEPQVLISYLRSSFCVRDQLKSGVPLRDKFNAEFIRRGLNKEIMIGLD